MKIKKFKKFINESLIYHDYIWKLNKSDIKEYFYDLLDIGYIIDIGFGIYENIDPPEYSEFPRVGNNIPCYLLTIIASSSSFNDSSSKYKSENLTDSVLFAIDMINKYANSKSILTIGTDPIDELNLNLLKIENGIYYGSVKLHNISICFVCNEEVEIKNSVQLSEIYGWKDAIIKDNDIYTKVNLIDLVDLLISDNSSYKKLFKNWENIEEYYNIIDYYPDLNYVLSELNENNKILLIKSLIKEYGIKEFKFDKEEECINYYIKRENFYELDDIIKSLKKIKPSDPDNNPLDCIFDIIAEYRMIAHINENYKDLVKEFDRIVKKDFTFYKETIIEYNENITYYYIKFDIKWLYQSMKYHSIQFLSLSDVFENYFNNNYFNYELNPRWSDYGDYNLKSLNKDISHDLKYFLK